MFESHPKLNTPDDSQVIWRYFDLPKFLSLISTTKLYFRRCDKFQDKWDSTYSMLPLILKYDGVNELEKKRVVRNFLAQQAESRATHFASCWHKRDDESAAMWEIYAARSQGIAIRSTIGNLKKACGRSGAPIFIGEVKYEDFQKTDLIDHSNGLQPVFVKRKEYDFEGEVRVLIWSTLCSSGGHETEFTKDRFGLLCPVDIQTLIGSVVVAPSLSKEMVEVIQNTLRRFKFEDIPVQHSKLADEPFSIDDWDEKGLHVSIV